MKIRIKRSLCEHLLKKAIDAETDPHLSTILRTIHDGPSGNEIADAKDAMHERGMNDPEVRKAFTFKTNFGRRTIFIARTKSISNGTNCRVSFEGVIPNPSWLWVTARGQYDLREKRGWYRRSGVVWAPPWKRRGYQDLVRKYNHATA